MLTDLGHMVCSLFQDIHILNQVPRYADLLESEARHLGHPALARTPAAYNRLKQSTTANVVGEGFQRHKDLSIKVQACGGCGPACRAFRNRSQGVSPAPVPCVRILLPSYTILEKSLDRLETASALRLILCRCSCDNGRVCLVMEAVEAVENIENSHALVSTHHRRPILNGDAIARFGCVTLLLVADHLCTFFCVQFSPFNTMKCGSDFVLKRLMHRLHVHVGCETVRRGGVGRLMSVVRSTE
jgi:hypothetical protein